MVAVFGATLPVVRSAIIAVLANTMGVVGITDHAEGLYDTAAVHAAAEVTVEGPHCG